ncbi:hypothetical protein AYL99_06433 [Fonsecaea erecta]|uniref:Uncharacterized protein n=1 Tax=Fonsecaea erecta TaxID=1367422 RepID=A0A178ZJC2_9EURO|nr:hypothetical protein AYL99_06433 [Fonsecaea erecta]OAP59135.1 hypothetical protein AYL99_06433 [Fonsecaea erecta]
MANSDQGQEAVYIMESRVDNGPLLKTGSDNDSVPSHDPKASWSARQLLSFGVIGQGLLDFLIALTCAYFIVFAALVYTRRDQPVDQQGNQGLLEAAKYSPTIFPILFSAVAAKFLKAIAAVKLENGASVLALEYLLQSRSVFSTFMAPITLKTVNVLTPFLCLLWALSPLGGQAGLRVISTHELYSNTTQNFTYLSFVSNFSNQGVGSASAEPLIPINAIFTSAIIGSAKSKGLAQDQFGHVKIPVYESLSANAGSDWRAVPDSGDVEWSSLTGLPIHNLPSAGVSRFTMNTGYMVASCNVSGHNWTAAYRQSLEQFVGWSGANYALTPNEYNQYAVTNFTFRSLDIDEGDDLPSGKILTVANCTVGMSYVEVQIKCDGQTCQSVAARPSENPASHRLSPSFTSLGVADWTPINGLGQVDLLYMAFFPDFTNATNPTVGCDTVFCPPSAIEAYLADPSNVLVQTSTTKLWKLGNKTISKRFSQLLNTYWIDSIAPSAISGNFTVDPGGYRPYTTDSTLGTITTGQNVVKCDFGWLAIMLVCSLVLFIIGLATVVLGACRRGPDVLDKFSSLLRDNPYASYAHVSSMEDASDQSKRVGDLVVRLGDVRPEDDLGYVAIGVLDSNHVVQKLSTRRSYA